MSDHTHAPAEEPDERPDPDLDPASMPEPHGDLGPMLEEYLRRAMLLSSGDPSVFFERPISAGLLITSAIVLAIVFLPGIRRRRAEVFVEED